MPIAIDRIKAMESKGQSKRNRYNMESDFVLPCYKTSLLKLKGSQKGFFFFWKRFFNSIICCPEETWLKTNWTTQSKGWFLVKQIDWSHTFISFPIQVLTKTSLRKRFKSIITKRIGEEMSVDVTKFYNTKSRLSYCYQTKLGSACLRQEGGRAQPLKEWHKLIRNK